MLPKDSRRESPQQWLPHLCDQSHAQRFSKAMQTNTQRLQNLLSTLKNPDIWLKMTQRERAMTERQIQLSSNRAVRLVMNDSGPLLFACLDWKSLLGQL